MGREPTDIVLLTYDRLDYLVRAVDSIDAHTPEAHAITIVDNGSGPEVRNWLASNRRRFRQVIMREQNDYPAAIDEGILATTSDPYVLSDADLVLPESQPSWLALLHGLMERHPDFGLIGLGLDPVNRTPGLPPEQTEPRVAPNLIEGNVGIWYQMIRRAALTPPYVKDSVACQRIRDAGFRVGWTPAVRPHHLGWDDVENYPEYVAFKHERGGVAIPEYRHEMALLPEPPALSRLAKIAPVAALTRREGVSDAALLEVTWDSEPALASSLKGPVALISPEESSLPLDDNAAGAVVLVHPPSPSARKLLVEASRIATSLVIVVGTPRTFAGAGVDELAPDGWTGSELPGTNDLVMSFAQAAERLPAMRTSRRYTTLQDRDRWLQLFQAGTFGRTRERLFAFRSTGTSPPPTVRFEPGSIAVWRPPAPKAPSRRWERAASFIPPVVRDALRPRTRFRRLKARARMARDRRAL